MSVLVDLKSMNRFDWFYVYVQPIDVTQLSFLAKICTCFNPILFGDNDVRVIGELSEEHWNLNIIKQTVLYFSIDTNLMFNVHNGDGRKFGIGRIVSVNEKRIIDLFGW